MVDFAGRVAIVTGAGLGMGRAHARELAAHGARVVVNDVSATNAAETVRLVEQDGGTAVADVHDVSSDAAAIVTTAIESYGQLDVVVSNAGIIRVALFADQDPHEFWKVFDVSFKGTVDLSRAAWPYLVASGTGSLVLVSSSGLLANPGASAYGAAKGAVWALGNTLAAEGERVGVRVNTLMPTAWTPMTEGAYSHPDIIATLRDGMGPEHVAAFVAFLAHQDTAVSGEFFQVSGGRAGRLVLAGQERIVAPESSPEGWAQVADRLVTDAPLVTSYRNTGDQFASEMIAVNPAVAEAFKSINPAVLGA